MYSEIKNNKKLEKLHLKALNITSAILHPHIMEIIHESNLVERQWAVAASDFFDAFKSFGEAGTNRRIQCLEYLVPTNMLMDSEMNPFDAQEAFNRAYALLLVTTLLVTFLCSPINPFPSPFLLKSIYNTDLALEGLVYGNKSKGMRKYTAIDTWNTQVKSLFQRLTTRIG